MTCAAAGIEDLHFHDLRRAFACRLLEAKTDLHDVRESWDTRTSPRRARICARRRPGSHARWIYWIRSRRRQRNLPREELRHPVILMGDFNDRPISVVHRSLRQHFTDAFAAVGKRSGATFRLGPIPMRLDHIYVSRSIRVLDCWVRNDELTRMSSDHRPVIASVTVTWP